MTIPEIKTSFVVKFVLIIATLMLLAHWKVHILITNDSETIRCIGENSIKIGGA